MTAVPPLLATEATPTTAGQDTANATATEAVEQKQAADAKPEPKEAKGADQGKDEGKPQDGKPTDAKPEPEGAPELYEFEVPKGLPEGHQLDEKVLDSFTAVVRELNLPQAKAQQLLDKVLPAIHQRTVEQQAEIHSAWVKATKTDKELGGQALDQNLAVAKRAMKTFGSEGLQQLLNGPLGSHPEVVRFLVKVGKTVSEDQFVGGDRGQADLSDPATQARKLYGKSAS